MPDSSNIWDVLLLFSRLNVMMKERQIKHSRRWGYYAHNLPVGDDLEWLTCWGTGLSSLGSNPGRTLCCVLRSQCLSPPGCINGSCWGVSIPVIGMHPTQGRVELSLVTSCHGNQEELQWYEPLDLTQTKFYLKQLENHVHCTFTLGLRIGPF